MRIYYATICILLYYTILYYTIKGKLLSLLLYQELVTYITFKIVLVIFIREYQKA